MLKRALAADEELSESLGLDPTLSVEIHEFSRAARSRPSGGEFSQMIVALVQARELTIDGAPHLHLFRGGATLIVDLADASIQYAIVKHVTSNERERKMRDYLTNAYADPALRLMVERPAREAFGVLHGVRCELGAVGGRGEVTPDFEGSWATGSFLTCCVRRAAACPRLPAVVSANQVGIDFGEHSHRVVLTP